MPFEAIWNLVLVPKHPKKKMNPLHCVGAARDAKGASWEHSGEFKERSGSDSSLSAPKIGREHFFPREHAPKKRSKKGAFEKRPWECASMEI
jgi:hypothetical protein